MKFSRPNRRLQDTFPSSSREYPQPQELGDNVHLVHPYPGRIWEDLVAAQLTGGSAVTPFVLALNPSREEWNELVYADVSHTSATARALQLTLISPTGFNIFVARFTNMVAALTTGQPSGFEPLFGSSVIVNAATGSEVVRPPWPVVVPPGYQLVLSGDTAGAAYQVSLTVVFSKHFLSDSPLTI